MLNGLHPIVTNAHPLPQELYGGVVAIGNFDGIHRGHQRVLKKAREKALQNDLPALVLVFHPHPRHVIFPHRDTFLLTPSLMRLQLLDFLDFHALVEYPFTEKFSKISASEFVFHVLKKTLGARHIVIGSDFHFGKNRHGTPDFLISESKKHGFNVSIVKALQDKNKATISSTRIRNFLSAGNVSSAAELLGYHYTIREKVIFGQQLGRTLGFPTANMILPEATHLHHGVYAVHFRRSDGSRFKGVANFGLRPTIGKNTTPLLETFIFDFSEELYGELCDVSFFALLRDEIKFETLQSLTLQMKNDALQAQTLLKKVKPLSFLDQKIAFEGGVCFK